jgi:hypothetical protein
MKKLLPFTLLLCGCWPSAQEIASVVPDGCHAVDISPFPDVNLYDSKGLNVISLDWDSSGWTPFIWPVDGNDSQMGPDFETYDEMAAWLKSQQVSCHSTAK